jgi:outer membrane biogenesis lipoprotein LolB
MKKQAFFTFTLLIASAIAFLTGCSWSVGSSSTTPKTAHVLPTTGQQLIDLQKARELGAITDPEYQAQKAKLLGNK